MAPTGLLTRFFFAHLIPGSTLVCIILFLVTVPVEEGYRISLLEWSLDSDRVFPYLVGVGLVASAVLGSLAQAARALLVDGWARRRAFAREAPAGSPEASGEGAPAPNARETPGPLAELYGNLALALLVGTGWSAFKIIRGGGTDVFPRGITYGVPLAGLAACALLFAFYRRLRATEE
jgi:hypothetical protein